MNALWMWPWFGALAIPMVVVGFARRPRAALWMLGGAFVLAALWVRKGCGWEWTAGPLVSSMGLLLAAEWLERRVQTQGREIVREEAGVKERLGLLRAEKDQLQDEITVTDRGIHEISELYELSKRFLGTLEEPEALKIVEESLDRWMPQWRPSDRNLYLERVKKELKQGEITAAVLVETIPPMGADFVTRERWGIVGEQMALGLQRVRLYQSVQESATHDGLTGLLVRRTLRERLEAEIHRSKRHSFPLTFLMVDLDRFKQVNDTYGHLVGDVVLREVARLIRGCVREVDLVGRDGGEEFSVVLPEMPLETGLQIAERIRKSLEGAVISAYDEKVRVTVSIGAAVYPDQGSSSKELVERADQALYQAKEMGRNQTRAAE